MVSKFCDSVTVSTYSFPHSSYHGDKKFALNTFVVMVVTRINTMSRMDYNRQMFVHLTP